MKLNSIFEKVRSLGLYETSRSGIRTMDMQITPLLADGKTEGYIVQIQDITERKMAEEALLQSEEQYKFLFEYSGVAIGYYKADGTVISYNQKAAENMGGKAEDFTGKSIFELFPKADAEIYMDRIQMAIEGQNSQYYEDCITLSPGTIWFLSTFNRIVDTNNNVVGIQIISQDITSRKQSEQEIKESEERFRTIFEQAPIGVALVDSLTGKMFEINQRYADITGWTMAEACNTNWMSITHPDDIQADLDNMTLVNTGVINEFTMDKRFRKPDGSFIWTNMTVASIKLKEQQHPRHLCMISDITENKLLEAALAQEKMLLETTLISVGDGVISTDKNGNILLLNRVAESLTGWTQDEAKGKPFTEVFNIINEFTQEKSEDIDNIFS